MIQNILATMSSAGLTMQPAASVLSYLDLDAPQESLCESRANRDILPSIPLHAIDLDDIETGDLVVIAARPGRQDQWGVVTRDRAGELVVHHTDNRSWSKSPLEFLSRCQRVVEAYRPE